MPSEATGRLQWNNLPSAVQEAVEALLGDAVASADSQTGGYSPGTADRISTVSGKRAFVKAVGKEQNRFAAKLHRIEARTMDLLPEGLPRPDFLGHHDDGDWIALAFSDVDGRHPHLPWRSDELDRVLDTVHSVTQKPLGEDALELLPYLGVQRAYSFQGWDRLREVPDESLDPWAVSNLDALAELSEEALSSVVGNSLVHTDLRADNLLLTEDGNVTIVDWPWAAIGAPWFDALTILIDVRVYDPSYDVDAVIAQHLVFDAATSHELNTVLAGLAGYFLDAARQPAPQGIPTLRSFQRQEGVAALNWLKERL